MIIILNIFITENGEQSKDFEAGKTAKEFCLSFLK
jgi:hypothetical protein